MIINLNNDYGYKWSELYYIEFKIQNSYDALIKLNDSQEKSLSESTLKINNDIREVEKINAELDPRDLDSYITHMFRDEEILIEELSRLQRYSLVMSIFSFYESQLKAICKLIEIKYDFKIRLRDLNSSNGDLFKYWTYLIKVYGLPKEKLEKFFTPINLQKSVRNIIAHSGGEGNVEAVKKIIEGNGIKLKTYNKSNYQIDIEKDIYVRYLLNLINAFFKELLKTIDTKYNEINK